MVLPAASVTFCVESKVTLPPPRNARLARLSGLVTPLTQTPLASMVRPAASVSCAPPSALVSAMVPVALVRMLLTVTLPACAVISAAIVTFGATKAPPAPRGEG